MSFRIPIQGMAYAIREERANWLQNCTPAERAAANEALSRVARALALTLHPSKQAEFLQRSNTEEA